jgi:hypothetical protein
MAFEKGHQKYGGRKKGTPNKKTILRVEEVLAERGVHPVVEILKLLPNMPASDAAKTLIDLLKFCQPPAKAAEGEGDALPPLPPDVELSDDDITQALS